VSKRSRYAPFAALTLAALAVTAVWHWPRPHPPADLASWDEARLARELEGLGYHVHEEPRDREGGPGPKGFPRAVYAGLYVAKEEPADWEEVASRPRGDASRWAGCAVATRGRYAVPGRGDYLTAGPWLFYGDPALLNEVGRSSGLR
jgi:hypothetical protein